MRFTLPRRTLLGLALLAGLVGLSHQPAAACPFCTMQGQTLTGDVNQAAMVVFGTLKNAKLDPNGEFGQGTTELEVEAVVKKHDILGDKKVLLLPRYVPSDSGKPTKFLIFCDVFKGKVDPYRGVPVKADSDIVKYLTGALAVKDKEPVDRLRFFFDYLDSPDIEVGNDAYKEFGNADPKYYVELGKRLPADKLAKWLQDPSTPSFRFGLYAVLLGHCGQDKYATLLRSMLDDPKKKSASGVDGMLAGYVLLRPKEGWDYITGQMKDASQDFLVRYAALRAARFFMDTRSDVVPKPDVVQGVALLLDQPDIADLAIEDLRKWKAWDRADEVLAVAKTDAYEPAIVKRSILRYCLQAKDSKAAEAYVAAKRKADAEAVSEAEELLQLEADAAKPKDEKKPAKKDEKKAGK
jgi:hypothetical protein